MTTINPYKYSQVVIVGNGEFPTTPLTLKILKEATTVILCDGAANSYIKTGRNFDVIIGDGDSVSTEVKQNYASKIIINSDQETNDQTKAINFLYSKGITEISIIGATGKREDHSLGNISLLIDYMQQGINAKIFTDYGVFIPITGNAKVLVNPKQKVSIFNYNCTEMSAIGLKYPIRAFNALWQGTLNEALNNEIIISTNGQYLLYLAH
jgi:thiamine pyrophosphokinase